jgi:hypothetical protein
LRILGSLIIDKNNEAVRSKVKSILESSITGSTVEIYPIDPLNPTILAGTLYHEHFQDSLHFQIKVPPADQCLVCGEAIEHVKVYGCVAGIIECPYEPKRISNCEVEKRDE